MRNRRTCPAKIIASVEVLMPIFGIICKRRRRGRALHLCSARGDIEKQIFVSFWNLNIESGIY